MNNIIAVVEIAADTSLEIIAGKLEVLIKAGRFGLDESGNFEEVPAFVAHDGDSGINSILFGIPDGETSDAYVLECSAETVMPIHEYRSILPLFFKNIVIEKEINSRGYFDYSDELAKALCDNGIMASKSLPQFVEVLRQQAGKTPRPMLMGACSCWAPQVIKIEG